MYIPVVARSKVWVCGLSLAGILNSNLAGGTDVSYESSVLSGRGLCVAALFRPSRGVLPSVLSGCDRQASLRRPDALAPREKKKNLNSDDDADCDEKC
jgi:hypothetical protein